MCALASGPEERELRPLEDRLVEVHGLTARLEPSAATRAHTPGVDSIDVNGERGRAIGWSEAAQKYVVETFDGFIIGVPEGNLREFEPPAPEDGGFDVVWPAEVNTHDMFAADITFCLEQKGYCVIQTFTTPQVRAEASGEAAVVSEWTLPAKDLEVPYLGNENVTKFTHFRPAEFREGGALWQCDQVLTNVGMLLQELAPDRLGFSIDGRTNTHIRVPFAHAREAEQLRPDALADADYRSGGQVCAHVTFLDHRKVNAMLLVENDGGEVVLHPTPGNGRFSGDVRLPISRNRLLLFLDDRFGYTYRPAGEDHLLLQAWSMTEPLLSTPEPSRVVCLPAPQQLTQPFEVMSMHVRIPGGGRNSNTGWQMWCSGTDGAVKVPRVRFDADLYYNPDQMGMLYTWHGAIIDDSYMEMFDNVFFEMPVEEAGTLSVGQKNILETGVATLAEAGYTRSMLRGQPIAMYLGDKNTDRRAVVPSRIAEAAAGGAMHRYFFSGHNSGCTGSRLSHILDLRGPCYDVDTACSSALVALGEANKAVRIGTTEQRRAGMHVPITSALVMGMDLIDEVFTYMAYCATQMVSPGGRSFTYDESANGFLRGDAAGGIFCKQTDSDEDLQKMLACVLGTNVNQDGRSASLSAPHGPSQQQCIKASMKEAGLSASEISIAECHGTGTALGDPIEVGALREVMKTRETAIIITSAKSNFGHTEAAAGIAGIERCVLMLNATAGAANLHLRHLNPHIEHSGYPALFITELQDVGCNSAISGVSSFGVGGTNARGDVWSRGMFGSRATTGCVPLKLWRLERARLERIVEKGTLGPTWSDRVSIVGTWNAWSAPTEMDSIGDGLYTTTVVVRESRWEKFRLVLNDDAGQSFYPVGGSRGDDGTPAEAAATAAAEGAEEVSGPNWDHGDRGWVIDGREDDVPAGTVYRVHFEWGFTMERGEYKRVYWEKVEGPSPAMADGNDYDHRFYITGSWTAWELSQMTPTAKAGTYEARFRVGIKGQEEFQFVRDKDWDQVIHPAVAKASKPSIPVRGPDDKGHGKNWVVRGSPGELMSVQLEYSVDSVAVKVHSAVRGTRVWRSQETTGTWHQYSIVGTWTGWQFSPMSEVPGGAPGTYELRITLGASGFEEFQVVRDDDWGQTLHPDRASAPQGCAPCGPDRWGQGLNWRIVGEAGSTYDICLLDDPADPSTKSLWWADVTASVRDEAGSGLPILDAGAEPADLDA